MKIGIRDKRVKNHNSRKMYKVIIDCEKPDEKPLTTSIKTHYENNKSVMGYAKFDGLTIDEIMIIISNKKCVYGKSRYGVIIGYRILED